MDARLDVSVGPAGTCVVRDAAGRCQNPATPGLAVCGPCLTSILAEPDPGRRRSLAGVPGLPTALVERLTDDPDAGVRAVVATRADLDPARGTRYADPTREPDPLVWRNLAASPAAATYGAALAANGDPITSLVLATNPSTPPDVIATLAARGDAELADTVAAVAAGRAPAPEVIDRVLAARSIPTRPLADPPVGSARPDTPADTAGSPPGPPRAPGTDGDGTDRPASNMLLVAGFFVVLALIVAAAVIIVTRGGGAKRSLEATGPATTIVAVTATPVPSTAPGDDAGEGTGVRPVTLVLTVTAGEERFCDAVDLRIDYDADEDVDVVITDDGDRILFDDTWPSGVTNTIEVVEPSADLHAELSTRTDDPEGFQPSGTVSGNLC